MLQALSHGIICCFYESDATLTCSYEYNNCDNPSTAISRNSYDAKFSEANEVSDIAFMSLANHKKPMNGTTALRKEKQGSEDLFAR